VGEKIDDLDTPVKLHCGVAPIASIVNGTGRVEQPVHSQSTNRKPRQVVLAGVGAGILLVVGIVELRSGLRSLRGGSGRPDSQERAMAAEMALRSMKTFKDPSGFAMDYPASWDDTPTLPGMLLTVRNLKGTVNLNVSVEDQPPGTTVAQYEQAVDELVARKFPQLKYQKLTSRDMEISGLPARVRISSVEIHSDGKVIPARQIAVFCMKGNKAYLINGSAMEDWFPQFEPVFNRMISSIKISD
jgi:hypothetical protein